MLQNYRVARGAAAPSTLSSCADTAGLSPVSSEVCMLAPQLVERIQKAVEHLGKRRLDGGSGRWMQVSRFSSLAPLPVSSLLPGCTHNVTSCLRLPLLLLLKFLPLARATTIYSSSKGPNNSGSSNKLHQGVPLSDLIAAPLEALSPVGMMTLQGSVDRN